MQVLGPQNKRKSVQKVQPQMPKKIEDRQLSSNRTKHKLMDSPDHQIKNYKRKDLNVPQKLQQQKSTLSTDRSLIKLQSQKKHMKSTNTYNQTSIMESSRFLQDHHNTESLSQLLNAKTKNNSLVITGRLMQKGTTETQNKQVTQYTNNQQNQPQKKDSLEVDDEYDSNTKKRSSYDVQYQSNELEEDDSNFADYVYGGADSESAANKQPKPKIFTKVKTYSVSTHLLKRPEHWIQQNRYKPNSQQQVRMQLQHFNKQKQFINLKREQDEIVKMIQEYRINKNAVMNHSKRKSQSQNIMAKFYKQRTLNKIKLQNSQKQKGNLTHTSSLPVLKAKMQIIVPQISELNNQCKDYPTNLLQKRLNSNQKRVEFDHKIKASLSSGKLGFGTKQSRKLYEEQIIQNQLQNVQKLQRKLRDKGVVFNSADIRKSLLNQRVFPSYQSSQATAQQGHQNSYKHIFPQKQLTSNPIYKKYPL